MNKTASFELLSSLKGLKTQNVLQTELGWVVERRGSPNAVWPDCGVVSKLVDLERSEVVDLLRSLR